MKSLLLCVCVSLIFGSLHGEDWSEAKVRKYTLDYLA